MAAITPRYARQIVSVDPALAELYEDKTQTYAAFGNGAVAAHADASARRRARARHRLCVGRAAGAAAPARRLPRGPRAVRAAAARLAGRRPRHQGAIEIPGSVPGPFDLIVLADVLGTSPTRRGPGARRRWCRPGATVLVSVPNIAHFQARLTLLRGRWPQEDTGTFDASHLRWFTRDAVERAAHGRQGLRDVQLHAIVPALRNHPPGAAARLAAPRWSRPGRRSAAARRGCSATRSSGSAGADRGARAGAQRVGCRPHGPARSPLRHEPRRRPAHPDADARALGRVAPARRRGARGRRRPLRPPPVLRAAR